MTKSDKANIINELAEACYSCATAAIATNRIENALKLAIACEKLSNAALNIDGIRESEDK